MGWVVVVDGKRWETFAYELSARDLAWVLLARGWDVEVVKE